MLVDSHCHLNYEGLREDIPGVLERARAIGVSHFLTINTCLEQSAEVVKIAETYKDVSATVGAHPCDVTAETCPTVEALARWAVHPKVVGLGETGLDYYHDARLKEVQHKSLAAHMEVAETYDLPLIIHAREAEEDLIKLLKPAKKREKPGVIHCFTGSENFANVMLEYGFYISISGVVTFKNAQTLRDIVKTVPMDRLLVETDSPYLAPVPKRGKPNEPSYVRYTAEKVAEIKDLSLAEVGHTTTNNFFRLFKKAKRTAP
tara:strand:- start:16332 stop:17114 length:783 start_codon:yes stop_codon:yes gene_type:complete